MTNTNVLMNMYHCDICYYDNQILDFQILENCNTCMHDNLKEMTNLTEICIESSENFITSECLELLLWRGQT